MDLSNSGYYPLLKVGCWSLLSQQGCLCLLHICSIADLWFIYVYKYNYLVNSRLEMMPLQGVWDHFTIMHSVGHRGAFRWKAIGQELILEAGRVGSQELAYPAVRRLGSRLGLASKDSPTPVRGRLQASWTQKLEFHVLLMHHDTLFFSTCSPFKSEKAFLSGGPCKYREQWAVWVIPSSLVYVWHFPFKKLGDITVLYLLPCFLITKSKVCSL